LSDIGSRTLAEFITLSKDGEWGKGEPFDDSVQMRVIRGTDFDKVRSGNWSGVPIRYVSRKHAELKALQDGDLLIETAGGSPGRPTGRTIFLRRGSISGQNLPVTCASFARFIRLDPTLVEPEFVFWWLQHQYATRQLLAFHTQHTGVARFQWTTCSRSIVVPQVTRPNQRKIAAILSAYDDLIENNGHRIKLLEEMARRIYREWFVDFRYPGHEAVPRVDSELGPIPQGWEVSPVGSITQILGGGTPSKVVVEYWEPGTITWFTPTDLTRESAMFISASGSRISEQGLAKSSAKLFPPRAVMMTSRATVGVVAITTVPAATNQGFITCVPTESVGTYHLYFWLIDQRDLITSLASGATFREINKATFRTIPFVKGSSEIERQFEDYLEPFGLQILDLLRTQRTLLETRDLLLPRLISGDLNLTEVDIAMLDLAA
jgi:type I restriction enzyme S subunit